MSAAPRASRPRRAISWLGLAAIAGGLALIRLYFDHPRLASNPNPMIAVVYLGTGCILIMWGLRALVAEVAGALWRGRAAPVQRYRIRMPPEAFVYMLILVVLCLGALLGRSNMLMLVFGLTAGPFVLNGQMTLGILKRLRVTRRLPAQATVGENFSVTLSLANQKRFLSSWMVVAEDMVQIGAEQLQPAVLFSRVPAQARREGAYEICPMRRGLYEFGPVRVMSRFPLGLMERSFELGSVDRFTVLPRIGRLKPRWRQADRFGEAVADRTRVRAGTSDDEFHRLREYRGGDNPRAIHWRTTARRNELMVREYQHNLRRDLVLVVDLWLPARGGADDRERVELAVSFATSICVEQIQAAADAGLDLTLCGKKSWRTAGAGVPRAGGGLLERLALVEAGPSTGLAAVLRDVSCQAAPLARKVLITTRRAEALRAALPPDTEPGGGADFEVIEADARTLSEYLDFEDRAAVREPA